jgi:23S rRNA (cytidine1920-2'-O)/16S rRNA (cytidine1409-2'-O)-methyltransferase
VVRDPAERREALSTVARAATDAGIAVLGFASSGLPGPKGNRETFMRAAPDREPLARVEAAILEVEP